MKPIEISFEFFGKKYNARFRKSSYVNGGNLYIGVVIWEEDGEYWEPWCDLTVNLPGQELKDKQALLDTNNCPPVIIDILFDKGFIRDTGIMMPSGFCIYPLVEFTEEFLNNVREG